MAASVFVYIVVRGVFGTHEMSTMDLFCENSRRNIAINYIFEKAPSQMFDSVLNIPLDVVIVNRKNDFWYFSDFLLFGQVLENIHGEI